LALPILGREARLTHKRAARRLQDLADVDALTRAAAAPDSRDR
jgi:hypothetical protein